MELILIESRMVPPAEQQHAQQAGEELQQPQVGSSECQQPQVGSSECQQPQVGSSECQQPQVGSSECQQPQVGSSECVPVCAMSCTSPTGGQWYAQAVWSAVAHLLSDAGGLLSGRACLCKCRRSAEPLCMSERLLWCRR